MYDTSCAHHIRLQEGHSLRVYDTTIAGNPEPSGVPPYAFDLTAEVSKFVCFTTSAVEVRNPREVHPIHPPTHPSTHPPTHPPTYPPSCTHLLPDLRWYLLCYFDILCEAVENNGSDQYVFSKRLEANSAQMKPWEGSKTLCIFLCMLIIVCEDVAETN